MSLITYISSSPRRLLVLAALLSVAWFSNGAHAEGLAVGVHLASMHIPARDGQNNDNFGLYVRTESGLTGGAYRNTLRRNTLYAGQTFDVGQVSVMVGAASGYQRKCTDSRVQVGSVPHATRPGGIPGPAMPIYEDHHECRGFSRGALTPVIAPSIALPSVLGTTPRLWVLYGFGKGSTVVHLGAEWGVAWL